MYEMEQDIIIDGKKGLGRSYGYPKLKEIQNKKMAKKIKWFCKKCGKTHELEIEEDEITTRMWCPECRTRMYRVKEEK